MDFGAAGGESGVAPGGAAKADERCRQDIASAAAKRLRMDMRKLRTRKGKSITRPC